MKVRVQCYAGHRGEEMPRTIIFDGRRIEVAEVLDQWLSPDHRYFKISGDDGALYILRHDVAGERWTVAFYDRLAAH